MLQNVWVLENGWRNHSNLWKPSKKWRILRTYGNQLSYWREEFSSTHLYSLLAIILMDEYPTSLALHNICEHFCCSLKIQKWWAASPTVKGRKALANNQQSKALNINFSPKTPKTMAKISSSTSPTYVSFIVELYCCWVSTKRIGLP